MKKGVLFLSSTRLDGTVPTELGRLTNLGKCVSRFGAFCSAIVCFCVWLAISLTHSRLFLVVFATYDTLVMGTIPTEVGLWTSLGGF